MNPNMYKILGLLYKDLVSIFPAGEVFHMGGDEVRIWTSISDRESVWILTFYHVIERFKVAISCWNSTKEITDAMQEEGMNLTLLDFLLVWSDFHKKSAQVLDNIVGTDKIPVILWSSQLTEPTTIEYFLSNQK